MTRIIDVIGEPVVALLLLGGACLSLISSFGMIRLPDFYTRSHAAGKTTTLGVLLVLVGAFLYFIIESGRADAKLLLGILFVFITAPVSSHLIGRAAYRSGVKPWSDRNSLDALHEVVYSSTMGIKVREAARNTQQERSDES